MHTVALEAWLSRAGYAGIFIATLIGNLGIPALGPAAILLMLPFVGSSDWWITAVVATAGETLGQFIQYGVARAGARSLLSRFNRQLDPTTRQRSRFEVFYLRYGSVAVFICRFIPGLKALSSFPAGAARMPIAPFAVYTFLGTSISCLFLSWFLHVARGRSSSAGQYIKQHGMLMSVVLLSCIALYVLLRKARKRATAMSAERELEPPLPRTQSVATKKP